MAKSAADTLDWLSSYMAINHVTATGHGYARRRSENDEMTVKALKQLHDEIIEGLNQLPGLGASHPHFGNYIAKDDVIKFLDTYFKGEQE